jgi:hypothetical protein
MALLYVTGVTNCVSVTMSLLNLLATPFGTPAETLINVELGRVVKNSWLIAESRNLSA